MAYYISDTFDFEFTDQNGQSFTVVYKTLTSEDLEYHDNAKAQWCQANPDRKALYFYQSYLHTIIEDIRGIENKHGPVAYPEPEHRQEFIKRLPFAVQANLTAGFFKQVFPSEDTKKKSTDTSAG